MHILTNASIFLVEVSQMCQTGPKRLNYQEDYTP
jgi:hypothetical protein